MSSRRRGRSLIVVLILNASLLAGCGRGGGATTPGASGGSPSGTPSGKVHVVTTMSILEDMVSHVGGDRVVAENLIPIGAGPEDYQPTPDDAQKIARANVIFYNGHGLEDWLDRLFQNAARAGVPRVELSKDLQAVDVGSGSFAAGNPHFWLNPRYAIHYVEVIRDTLKQADPGGANIYQNNATSYSAEIDRMDQELLKEVAVIPPGERKLVTNHNGFPYFAQHFGFTIVGNILQNPQAELSAGDLADLVGRVKAEHVKAVFAESQFSPRTAQTLAKEAGVSVVANLYTDTLGTDANASSYIAMMRYDIRTIVDALQGKQP